MNDVAPADTVRTLVVDDDFAVAAVHRDYLASMREFVVVGEAHLGADALRAADELAPDLVLLDVYLPDMSGLEVLRQLRSRPGPPVDVIAITAAREVETVREAMAGGVLHYLVKPFSLAEFRERLLDYATHRRELLRRVGAHGTALDQAGVDRLLSGSRRPSLARAPADVPKGLSARTLELVATTLRECQRDLSAGELAEQCGLSRVSARRYLEHLAASGAARVRPRYGAAGRPEHGYLWVASGR